MITSAGKITLANKYNSYGTRVYIPERVRLDGVGYVQSYRLQAAHPVGEYLYLVSLDDDVVLKLSFDPVTVDLRTPFTLPYVYSVQRAAAGNYKAGSGEYIDQVVSTDNVSESLIDTAQKQADYTALSNSLSATATASYSLSLIPYAGATGELNFKVVTPGLVGNAWTISSADKLGSVLVIDTTAQTIRYTAGVSGSDIYVKWRETTDWHDTINVTESGSNTLKVPTLSLTNFSGGEGVESPEKEAILTSALTSSGAFTLESLSDYKTRKGL